MNLEINYTIFPSPTATLKFPDTDDPSLPKMSMQGGTFISEDKASSFPSVLAQDSQNKETHHERETSLIHTETRIS